MLTSPHWIALCGMSSNNEHERCAVSLLAVAHADGTPLTADVVETNPGSPTSLP